MAKSLAFNMDCMEAMRQMKDKEFDLAIVDPPYGINITKAGSGIKCLQTVNVERERERERENAPQSVELMRSAERKTVIGGVRLSHPKFITRLMTKHHQMPNIFRNSNE